jgi:hypothetical protein
MMIASPLPTLQAHTAVVLAADGVRFVAPGPDRASLVSQLAGYVAERCDHTLWPSLAAKVRGLIDAGMAETAITMYFENVGDRWDEERLVPRIR